MSESQEIIETNVPQAEAQPQEPEEPQEFIINRQMVQAINLLIQGVRKGQAAGCYTLQESSTLFAAVQLLTGGTGGDQPQSEEQSATEPTQE